MEPRLFALLRGVSWPEEGLEELAELWPAGAAGKASTRGERAGGGSIFLLVIVFRWWVRGATKKERGYIVGIGTHSLTMTQKHSAQNTQLTFLSLSNTCGSQIL